MCSFPFWFLIKAKTLKPLENSLHIQIKMNLIQKNFILSIVLSNISLLSANKSIDFEVIMKIGFKGSKEKASLLKKFSEGSTKQAERDKLAEYVKKMVNLTPPNGDTKSWKKKTQALVYAVEKNDLKALEQAANCKACHSVHK